MNPQVLLTFAVPTYNRLDCLRLLLTRIEDEVGRSLGTAAPIEVLVCDNASTDGTAAWLGEQERRGWLRVLRQPRNLGADGNILSCVREARGRFLWICGDDDLPLPGVLTRVAEFVRDAAPDLLYLPSRWHIGELGTVPVQAPAAGPPERVSAMQLAQRANAYVTFISSWVFNRERYLALPDAEPGRYVGTSLVQLEWYLGLLAAGGSLHAAPSAWVLARGGNTGGYALFETFVARYHRILGEKLQALPPLRDFLQDHLLRGYLPGLVWGLRSGVLGRFEPLDWGKVEGQMAQAWPRRPGHRAWVGRIARWPLPLARLAMGWCWLDAQLWMRARRAGAERAS